MTKEKIDNEHLESLEVFMKHHYIADNGHYQWVKKRFKELQQENKQLESTLNEVREYIKENIYRDVMYREDDNCICGDWLIKEPQQLLQNLDKVGGSNE